MKAHHIYRPLILSILLCITASCSNDVSLSLDEEDSYVLVDYEREFLTVHATLRNDGSQDANGLYAEFSVDDEKAAEVLGFDHLLFNEKADGMPERFTVSENSGFFISEGFVLHETIPPEHFNSTITVQISNDEETLLEASLDNLIIEEVRNDS
ncbi:hypothetical protein [Alteribacillus iranensis]|uniref:DUF4352 domain-containing protein n=1 Tax=Alteribacillus iranensis TaxID=930128 RepID=A0A1I2D029_9BACI|nr:hypothetical protein [Alteribacillus iranensis]SFE73917.1 hypothetical protein SAMN05192532_103314 [Alteribacillus iranensis]